MVGEGSLIVALMILSAQVEAKNSPPVADVGSDLSCPTNHSITLSGSASDPDGDPIQEWHWQVSSSPYGSSHKLADTNTPTLSFRGDTLGDYTVSLFVYDGQDWSLPDEAIVSILPPPSPSISTTPENPGTSQEISFNANTTGGILPLSFLWAFGDGGSSTNASPQHQYAIQGTYNVSVLITDSYGQTGSDSVDVSVYSSSPTVLAAAVPSSGIAPLLVGFSATVLGGDAPLSYMWDFGDGISSTENSPTHAYNIPGSYLASLTVTDFDGDHSTTNLQIRAYAPLTITNWFSSAEGFIVEWLPVAGEDSVIAWSTNLGTMPFTNFPGNLAYPYNCYTDTVHGTESECFYRIGIEP